MRLIPLRLHPGEDLRLRLEALARDEAWPAAFVLSGIGSLSTCALRLAGAEVAQVLQGPMEIVSLAGSLSTDGAHLHAAVADADGRLTGGHVCAGCTVRTTAELVVAVMDDHAFSRRPDAATGYPELVIERLVKPR